MFAFLKPWVLLLAALLVSPALWKAFVAGTLDTSVALERFGIALALVVVARALFLGVVGMAAPSEGELVEDRRRPEDAADAQQVGVRR
jgi:hypothetical protein